MEIQKAKAKRVKKITKNEEKEKIEINTQANVSSNPAASDPPHVPYLYISDNSTAYQTAVQTAGCFTTAKGYKEDYSSAENANQKNNLVKCHNVNTYCKNESYT